MNLEKTHQTKYHALLNEDCDIIVKLYNFACALHKKEISELQEKIIYDVINSYEINKGYATISIPINQYIIKDNQNNFLFLNIPLQINNRLDKFVLTLFINDKELHFTLENTRNVFATNEQIVTISLKDFIKFWSCIFEICQYDTILYNWRTSNNFDVIQTELIRILELHRKQVKYKNKLAEIKQELNDFNF